MTLHVQIETSLRIFDVGLVYIAFIQILSDIDQVGIVPHNIESKTIRIDRWIVILAFKVGDDSLAKRQIEADRANEAVVELELTKQI